MTCDLRINEPRNPSIKHIMAAKKKEILSVDLSALNIARNNNLEIVSVEEPAKRKGGVKVESVDELIKKLRTEAKII
jgi:electron transfer flavoprotein beta subunit